MQTFARSRLAERALPSERLSSSEDLGWRTILARTFRDPAETEAFSTAQSPDLLVVLVTSGNYVVESRKGKGWQRAEYHPGSIGVTAPGNVSMLRWRTTSAQRLESLHMHISADLVDELGEHLGHHARRLPDALLLDDPLVAAAGHAIGRAIRAGAPALYADSIAHTLAIHLLYQAKDTTVRPVQPGEPALQRVTAYMREHLHDDVKLDDLAAEANLSKYHLLRTFAKTTGFTPHRYLVRLRMRHAADLLRDSRQSVLQVSIACGYRSPGQFAAAFRREYGTSPSEYRRQTQS